MTWNHRVIRSHNEEEVWYEIHEVYYHKNGKIKSWSAGGMGPCGESLGELVGDIHLMLKATEKPILELVSDRQGRPILKEVEE